MLCAAPSTDPSTAARHVSTRSATRAPGRRAARALTAASAAAAVRAPAVTAAAAAPRPALRAGFAASRGRLQVVAAGGQISTNELRNGTNVEIDGVPWKVVEFLHVKPGKGSAFVRSKLKNYFTGSVQEKTFRAGESLSQPDLATREAQFVYVEGDDYVFMDNTSYEETRLKRDSWAEYLLEGSVCELLMFNGNVISVEPPTFVELEVVDCPPGVRGNTASGGGTKLAKLETGATVQVPLFVEQGTKVKVDTRTGTYLSRA